MEPTFLVAGLVAVVVGLVHSILGERLIFRHLREAGWVPTKPAPPLRQRHIRILWATWHLASVFGFAFAGVFLALARGSADLRAVVVYASTAGFAAGAILVFGATHGRHPGWVGLLAVAICVWVGGVA